MDYGFQRKPFDDARIIELAKEGYRMKNILKAKKQYEEVSEMMDNLHEKELEKAEYNKEKELMMMKAPSEIIEAICETCEKLLNRDKWDKRWMVDDISYRKKLLDEIYGIDRKIIDACLDAMMNRNDPYFSQKGISKISLELHDDAFNTTISLIKMYVEHNELHKWGAHEAVLRLARRTCSHYSKVNNDKKKKVVIKTTMPDKRCVKYGIYHGQEFESQNALSKHCCISKKQVIKWKKMNYIEEV